MLDKSLNLGLRLNICTTKTRKEDKLDFVFCNEIRAKAEHKMQSNHH